MDKKYKALKRFGQNYLIDKNIIRKIIDEFQPQESDKIIEIGPGYGILTEGLAASKADITAVEIDNRVIEELQKRFPGLTVINKDFLKISLNEIFKDAEQQIRVIGNIPYNITSPILFKLFEQHGIVKDAMFMVQYEVAKRMTSGIGTKDYGILAVLLNYFAEVKFCFKVPPTVFRPQPKVSSAIVKINFKSIPDDVDEKLFIKVVKAAFGNRRKNLKNSLSNSIFKEYDLNGLNLDLTLRAERLSVDDFINLTKFFQKKS